MVKLARRRDWMALMVGIAAFSACSSPAPVSPPTTNAASQSGAVQSVVPTGTATPSTSGSPANSAPPTPLESRLGPDPCRLLAVDEVNTSLGGGYGPGGGTGLACIFPGDEKAGKSGLVSVAAVEGDVLTPVRARYPDLQAVSADEGTAAWSTAVDTLWLVVPGPRTVIVSVLGNDLPDDQLRDHALQLAKLAIPRI